MKADRGRLHTGPPLLRTLRTVGPRTCGFSFISRPTGEAPEVRILDVRIVLVSTLTRDKLAAFG